MGMKVCKIECIRKTIHKDLAMEYGFEGITKCPWHHVGDTYYADYAKPEGFCDDAWKAIHQYVFALAHGSQGPWYYDDWIVKDGVAVVCCQDGLRPTIFKITRTDQDAVRQYTPIPPEEQEKD